MLLVGILLGYFTFLVGFLLLWHEKVYKYEDEPIYVAPIEEPADPWEGFREARRKHPLPAAHSELEALEIDGPVHVRRPEVIVRVGR